MNVLRKMMGGADNHTLEMLLDIAETYGVVTIFGTSGTPRCYRVDIDFITQKGTKLYASSDRELPLKPAFAQAIERAEEIRGQFK